MTSIPDQTAHALKPYPSQRHIPFLVMYGSDPPPPPTGFQLAEFCGTTDTANSMGDIDRVTFVHRCVSVVI